MEHLADYRFQTAHELLTMLEQVNENSQDDTVKVVLSQMRKLGVLDSRTTEVKYGLWRYLMIEYRRKS
jgi:predicted transcriptional regulator